MTQRKRKQRDRRGKEVNARAGAKATDKDAAGPRSGKRGDKTEGEDVLYEVDRVPRRMNLILAGIPILLLLLAAHLAVRAGPFHWGLHIDPDSQYLQYSGMLADFSAPGNWQHPGTTTTVIGAVAIWVRWLAGGPFEGWEPIADAIIRRSDAYSATAAGLNALLICVLLFFAARQVYRLTGSLGVALAAQVSPLLMRTVVDNLWGFRPEATEILVGLGLVTVLAPVLVGAGAGRASRRPGMAYAAGCVIACGVGTKFNCASLVVLALLFPGIKQKLRAAAGFAVAVAVLLVPVMMNYERFEGWAGGRVERDNVVSISGPGALSELWNGLVEALETEPVIGLLGALYVLAGILLLRRGARDDEESQAQGRALLAGAAAIAGHLAITSTHFQTRYLLPALLVPFVMNPVLVRAVLAGRLAGRARAGMAAVCVVVCLYAFWNTGNWLVRSQKGWSEYRDHLAALEKIRNERGECAVLGLYRASLPSFGLFFGREYAGAYFEESLEKIYPGGVHYQRFVGDFLDWRFNGASFRVEDHVRKGGCVLLQGGTIREHMLPGWQAHPLLRFRKSRHESLYELSLDATEPALLPFEEAPRNAVVLEAEEFSRGNVMTSSVGGAEVTESGESPGFAEYEWTVKTERRVAFRVRYASEESRPLKVYLNGEPVLDVACHVPTGGKGSKDFRWHDLGMHRLKQGENVLRLETDGEFPLVDKIAVVRVPG